MRPTKDGVKVVIVEWDRENTFQITYRARNLLSRKTLYLKIIALASLIIFFLNMYCHQFRSIDYRLLYANVGLRNREVLADQYRCHLPQLDPYDASILPYIKTPDPLSCKRLQPELTYITENNRLVLNLTALKLENYKTALQCEYRCFDRTLDSGDVQLQYDEWVPISETAPIIRLPNDMCEFLETRCTRTLLQLSVYSNTHARIVLNASRVHELDILLKQNGPSKPASVLIFVLDSQSHSNFIRNLPKTVDVLRALYKATIFDGYTKIGDNSLPNAVAFLTGKRMGIPGFESELPDDMTKGYYDEWPLVWKEYAKRGYVTYYAEDYPHFNLFQYLSNGFLRKPVDHYFRPFWVHVWSSFLHMRSTHLCYGNAPKHQLQLDYLRRFLKAYANRPSFAINWLTELGHDWLNQVHLGDEDLADFFRAVRPYLNDTFVAVLSDHGHRFDAIRETVVGRVEERMPFFAISTPDTWSNGAKFAQFQYNLMQNSKMLTSPFDLHATLLHVLHFSTSSSDIPLEANGTERGTSLFTTLPPNRQCPDAGVPEEFCICQQEAFVSNASMDEKCLRAVQTALAHINSLLAAAGNRCAILRLVKVRQAQTFLPNLNAVLDDRVSLLYGGRSPAGFFINYRVMFAAEPGDGLFEATLRYSLKDDSFVVIGDVNRINKYGRQSVCVQSAVLRKYCYCDAREEENTEHTNGPKTDQSNSNFEISTK